MLNAFCMKRLIVYPEQCRRIFIESKLNNKKYQDIADEMGLSLQTVKNQVMIAVRKLREDLKDCLPLLAFLLGVSVYLKNKIKKKTIFFWYFW